MKQGMNTTKKTSQKPAKSTTTTSKTYKGFTEEEQAAMKELTPAEEARVGVLMKKAAS